MGTLAHPTMAIEKSTGSKSPPPLVLPTELGLGCVTFGREINREAAFAMMDHAAAHGVRVFDTASAYGAGASETIVGEWIASRRARERVVLATKVSPPYTPATLAAQFDVSLRRLNVETIDVLYFHRWDASVDSAALRALDHIVRSGRVCRLGASNFTAEQLAAALALQTELGTERFRFLQNIHNVAVRGVDDALHEICTRDAISIIAYSPLGAGFLTGKHADGVQPGSRFELIPGHQAVYFNEIARRRLSRLTEISARSGVAMTQLALTWALHQPRISCVLMGGRTPAHLDQALAARTLAVPELLRELDDA
jgi:1-deoxyxylulose-5-phosphate synthase